MDVRVHYLWLRKLSIHTLMSWARCLPAATLDPLPILLPGIGNKGVNCWWRIGEFEN